MKLDLAVVDAELDVLQGVGELMAETTSASVVGDDKRLEAAIFRFLQRVKGLGQGVSSTLQPLLDRCASITVDMTIIEPTEGDSMGSLSISLQELCQRLKQVHSLLPEVP